MALPRRSLMEYHTESRAGDHSLQRQGSVFFLRYKRQPAMNGP
uniref:Uncharacterized protein n=1 Tax=Arundo donax TaxID=35708 RepID=A0A0A8Y808_ARUDO